MFKFITHSRRRRQAKLGQRRTLLLRRRFNVETLEQRLFLSGSDTDGTEAADFADEGGLIELSAEDVTQAAPRPVIAWASAAEDSAPTIVTVRANEGGGKDGLLLLNANSSEADSQVKSFEVTFDGINDGINDGVNSLPLVVDTLVIDNADTGFSAPEFAGYGLGYTNALQGYQGDIHYLVPATGSAAAANWTFDKLDPDTYQVAVTISEDTNRANNSPFTPAGATTVSTVHVNQQSAPSEFASARLDDGVSWVPLDLGGNAGNFTVNGTTLKVQRGISVSGDAVRIKVTATDDGNHGLQITVTTAPLPDPFPIGPSVAPPSRLAPRHLAEPNTQPNSRNSDLAAVEEGMIDVTHVLDYTSSAQAAVVQLTASADGSDPAQRPPADGKIDSGDSRSQLIRSTVTTPKVAMVTTPVQPAKYEMCGTRGRSQAFELATADSHRGGSRLHYVPVSFDLSAVQDPRDGSNMDAGNLAMAVAQLERPAGRAMAEQFQFDDDDLLAGLPLTAVDAAFQQIGAGGDSWLAYIDTKTAVPLFVALVAATGFLVVRPAWGVPDGRDRLTPKPRVLGSLGTV